MLNVLNLLTAFKEKLVSQREIILDILEPYLDAITDKELELDITWQEGGFETEISEDKYVAYHDMFEKIVQRTVELPDGVTLGVTKEVITDETTTTTIYKDAIHDDEEICRIFFRTEGPYTSYFIGWNGWDVSHRSRLSDNLRSLYDGLLDTEAIATTAMTSIDLCCKGQLDPTNLSAALSVLGLDKRETVKQTVNLITSMVSGKESYQQAIGLINSFKELYSGATPGNITVDDDRIDFHTLDYSISSAILLPIDSVVASLSSVVGMIIAAFGHTIGFVLSAAGSAIAGLFNIAETTIGNDWNISPLAYLDNEACSTPIDRGTYAASAFPEKVVTYTKEYGYVRSENAFYVMYTWMHDPLPLDPSLELISFEIFPNVNVDIGKSINGNPNAYVTALDGTMTWGPDSFTFTPISISDLKTALLAFFANGENINTEYKIQSPDNNMLAYPKAQNRAITYAMLWQFSINALITLTEICEGSAYSPVHGIDSDLWWKSNPSDSARESWTMDDCKEHLASFLKWMKVHADLGQLDSWIDIESKEGLGEKGWANYTAGLINVVYASILKAKALDPSISTAITLDYLNIFDSTIDMGDVYTSDGDAFLGLTEKWSSVPTISYEVDFLVSPPKNRYNFTTRLVMTALVATAVATVTAVTTAKLKKKIAWKTQEKQNQLTSLREKYMQSGTYDDWDKLYKATKKYNRTYGFLTGTSFDMSNAWYNQTTSAGVFQSCSDVFPGLVKEDETTGAAAIDLSPVINLIK